MSLVCRWHSKRVQMQPKKRQARKVKCTLPVTYTKSSDICLTWAILPPQHMLCYCSWVFSTSQQESCGLGWCTTALGQGHKSEPQSRRCSTGQHGPGLLQPRATSRSAVALASLVSCLITAFGRFYNHGRKTHGGKKRCITPPPPHPPSKPGCCLSKEPTLPMKLPWTCYQAHSLCWPISQNPETNSTGKEASLLLSPELGLLTAGSVQVDFQQLVQVDMSKHAYFVPLDTQSSPLK